MEVKMLNKTKWHVRRWLERLTWPWLAAGGLLAFAAGFYFSMVEPADTDQEATRQKLLALQQEIRRTDHTDAKSVKSAGLAQLAVFYQFFPSERSIPDWMEMILAAASKHNLTLPEGKYQVSHDKTSKLQRYQITLPVKGTYPNLRSFINEVLTGIPIASLDNVKFLRQKIGEDTVESTVLFTLYLGRAS